MPHGITQYYLPPGRGDIPALTPAEAGTRLSDPGGMQGWVDLVCVCRVVYLPDEELEAAFVGSADVDLTMSEVSNTGFSVYNNRKLNCINYC